ncbi:MAG: DUF3299 domain-containing protein [Gemmatimonas sp.]|uniref:DUF3299 domain-containing protein n=1 Tax=Gemmatimonas sp. TaxID=1962908 RepID=UPI00391F0E87|nr:DUF3299 domain-containing protein [Gemmatimonadota bacterium]
MVRALQVLVVVILAAYWSVRPAPLPTEVLYGARHAPIQAPVAGTTGDTAADAPPDEAPDPTILTVDWRLLGLLDYRSTSVPPELARLKGRRVRIPGFIVPLEDFQERAKEFLLVPYFGACVHTPPPPPNQMVFVKLAGGPKSLALFDPVWVEGLLEVQRVNSPYGAVSFTMTGQRIVPYRED